MDPWLRALFGDNHRVRFQGDGGDGSGGTGSNADDKSGEKDTNTSGDGGQKDESDGDQKHLSEMGGKDDAGKDDSESKHLADDKDDPQKDQQDGQEPADKLTLKERPDWLPEKFFDAKTGEVNLEALSKSEADLRKRMGDAGNVPKDAAGYEFETPENLKAAEDQIFRRDEDGKDPIEEWFRDIAHEHQLPNATANAIRNAYIEKMSASMPAYDPAAEFKKLGGGSNAQALIRVNDQFGEMLLKRGTFNEEEHDEYWATMQSAAGQRMLMKIRQTYGDDPIPSELAAKVESSTAGELSEATGAISRDLEAGKINEPEANRRHAALQKKYETHYGTEPAGTSITPQP